MLWPYHWQALRAACAGTGGPGGGGPYDAIRALLTAEWRCEESMNTDDFVDSVGTRTLTQHGNPVAGGTYRSFGVNVDGERSTSGDDVLGVVNRKYTISVTFRTAAVLDAATRQVIAVRQPATGNLTFILRRETAALKLYHGDGAGGLASTTLVGSLSALTQYHVIWRLNAAGGQSLDWAVNGGAVTNWASGQNGTTVAPANHLFLLSDQAGEYWGDRIYRARLYSGTALTDAQMLLDYQDPRGV